MDPAIQRLCKRLGIEDVKYVEIEAKKRVIPEEAKDLRKHLMGMKGVKHERRSTFYDQFLDTPGLDVLKAGGSLRLRYKGDGTNVYLQYKGPGYFSRGLLFRSEFSTKKLEHVVREESSHDIVRFTNTAVRTLITKHVPLPMFNAMERHLGRSVVKRISVGHILAVYEKDKFLVDLGKSFLEPSLDRLFAFHINPKGLHSASTFWEYENEIKAEDDDLEDKLEHLDELLDFDKKLGKEFDLKPERLDKYHRCASYFL